MGDWFEDAGENVQDALEQGASASTNIAINAQPTDLSSSPWGNQQQLYSGDNVNVYCVDCGARGNVELGGSLGFSIGESCEVA